MSVLSPANVNPLPIANRRSSLADAKGAVGGRFEASVRAALAAHADRPDVAMNAVAALLDAHAGKGLQQQLRQLLADRPALTEVASRSYLHGNGFYKIVLAEEAAFKVRLHVWFPGASAEENIHDHRWWFASRILGGQLVSAVYEEAAHAEAAAYPEFLYFGRTASEDAWIKPIGQARLVRRAESVRRAGETYVLPPGVLHQILSADAGRMTATLMCQAAPARAWNRLLTSQRLQPDVAQRPLTCTQLMQVLERYLTSREANR